MGPFFKLGVVGKPVGLRGEFLLNQRADGELPAIAKVFIGQTSESALAYPVLRTRKSGGKIVLLVKGIDQIESAEKMQGIGVWVSRQDLSLDDQSEYFWGDLINKKVISEDGVSLGKIIGVNNFGASDVVEIEKQDGKKVALPFISVYFDLNFPENGEEVRVLMTAADFAEAWDL